MRHGSVWLIGAALMGAVGCSDGGSGPSGGDDEGARLATQFEDLADSVDGAGYSPTAAALRHAAEIVRLTGHATPVTLSIDGAGRNFLAVAEQIDFPQLQCTWPVDTAPTHPGEPPPNGPPVPPTDSSLVDPATGAAVAADSMMEPPRPPGECHEVGTFSMRTLIAWEPERMSEVVRLVADVGSNGVDSTVPDVMTGLPTNSTPDDAPPPERDPMPGDTMGGGGGGNGGGGTGGGGAGGGGSGGFPGFMGEYLVGDEGMWFAVEGTQTNELERSGGGCTADRARFDWAEFRCEQARFSYEFRMRVEPIRVIASPRPGGVDPNTGMPPDGQDPGASPEGDHMIAMVRTAVDGVRLTVVAWAPPPEPVPPPDGTPPDRPVPSDTAVVDPTGATH